MTVIICDECGEGIETGKDGKVQCQSCLRIYYIKIDNSKVKPKDFPYTTQLAGLLFIVFLIIILCVLSHLGRIL